MAAKNLVDSFASWAQGKPGMEPDVVQTLVDLKADYLGDTHPGRWRPGDLSEVLLELIPRKVSADDGWYDSVIPTTRSFLGFAGRKRALHAQSAPIQHLLSELNDIEPEFRAAVHDPARFGMAKSLFAHLGLDPEQMADDPSALQQAMDRFNAQPFAERRAITDPSLGLHDEAAPASLPAVRLASTEDLAHAARQCQLMLDLVRLAKWLGDGRKVTQTGAPALAEVRSLLSALGWEEALELAPNVRSAWEIPQLAMLWSCADVSGVVEVRSTRAVAGPRADVPADGSDDDVLGLWRSIFVSQLTAAGTAEQPQSPVAFSESALADAVIHAVISAYSGDEHTADELLDEFTSFDRDDQLGTALYELSRSLLLKRLAPLNELGVLRPIPATEPDAVVALSPLGVYGVRELVLGQGLDAPLAPDVRDLSAGPAFEVIINATPELSEELAAEWFAAQPHESAAVAAMLALASEGSAATRYAVLSLLDDVVDGGVAALLDQLTREPLLHVVARALVAEREALLDQMSTLVTAAGPSLDDLIDQLGDDAPELEPLRAALTGLGWLHGDFSSAERHLLSVESLARLVLDIEPPVRADDVPPVLWALVDDATLPDLAWCGHPDVVAVLDAVGSGHPTGRVRRAAKKAAYKLRSPKYGRVAPLASADLTR